MLYERKIRYLDYVEQGERIRGSGFAKLEARNTTLRIEITIKNAPIPEGSFPVFLMGMEKEALLGELLVQEGYGIFQYTCCITDEIVGTGIPYERFTGIHIPLEEGKEIACRWETPSAANSVSVEPNTLKAQELMEKNELRQDTPKEEIPQRQKERVTGFRISAEGVTTERIPAERVSTERIPEERFLAEKTPEEGVLQERVPEKRIPEKRAREEKQFPNREEEKTIRLQEDKWTQLCTIYPHIRPFRDEREYLSISPADFVLFPAADYLAAHNSFLLHGYYNYHHLILTRLEKRGEILYYLGVPGNFFEKEKQVAVMFGFESFECAEEPAEYGDFGYYMMRTNI